VQLAPEPVQFRGLGLNDPLAPVGNPEIGLKVTLNEPLPFKVRVIV
jgi:hypothetical protein